MGLTLALFAGIGAFSAPASAQNAVDLLETITIDLASDGTIVELESAQIAREQRGGGDDSTETIAIDPQEASGQLPVSLRTTYTLADDADSLGVPGTDLADLAGVDGRATINFSVANLTGRTEVLSVQDRISGDLIQVPVVVTTPMTVILTAFLPEDAITQVVQGADGTDGAVSQQEGRTIVQWGAVLAPPAVPGATEFQLVVDAEDFEIDDLTMTVEPGVSTDFNLDRIVNQVFGEEAQRPDTQTQIAARRVVEGLGEVNTQLNDIAFTVETAVGQKGRELIVALDSTTTDLQRQVEGLRTTVRSNAGAFEAAASSNLNTANSALTTAFAQVLRQIGYAERSDGLTEIALGQDGVPTTVLQLIRAVRSQLDSGGAVTTDLVSLLTTLLGDEPVPGSCPTDPAAERSLRCSIQDLLGGASMLSVDRLDGLAAGLDQPYLEATSALDAIADQVATVDDTIETADTQIALALADLGIAMDPDGTETTAAAARIADAITMIDAQILAVNDVGGVTETLTAQSATLGAAVDALDQITNSLTGGFAAQDQLVDAITYLCAAATGPVPDPGAGLIAAGLGGDCTMTPDEWRDTPAPDSVLAKVKGVLTLIEGDTLGPGLRSSVQIAKDGIDSAVDALGVVVAALVETRDGLRALQDDLENGAVYTDTIAALQLAQSSLATARTDELPAIDTSVAVARQSIDDQNAAVRVEIDNLSTDLAALLAANEGSLDQQTADSLAGSVAVVQQIGIDLEASSLQALNQTAATVTQASAANSASVASIRERISADVAALIAASSVSLDETARTLGQSTQAVFINLTGTGMPDLDASGLAGGGLQGTLRTELGRLGEQNAEVGDVQSDASRLGGQRRAAYVSRLIRNAQIQAGRARLQLEREPFAGEVPEGSDVATVYIFRLGSVD